jgi:hypothetical protein
MIVKSAINRPFAIKAELTILMFEQSVKTLIRPTVKAIKDGPPLNAKQCSLTSAYWVENTTLES